MDRSWGWVRRLTLVGWICLVTSGVASAELDDAVRFVIANGVGDSVESAAKNAAENALTQVVGTFIDAEKQLEKRREIRDGVLALSSQLDTRLSEYSQGSIASFQTLDVVNEGGVVRLEAQVGVRLSDFRAYVRELAGDSASISSSVFAQVAVQERNATASRDILIEKVILPILRGEASMIEVGDPKPFSQVNPAWMESLETRGRVPGFIGPTTIAIPVTIALKPGFLADLEDTLAAVATDQETLDLSADYCGSRFRVPSSTGAGFLVALRDRSPLVRLALFGDAEDREEPQGVRAQDDRADLNHPETMRLEFLHHAELFIVRQQTKLPRLRVTLNDESGAVVVERLLSVAYTGGHVATPDVQFIQDLSLWNGSTSSEKVFHLNVGSIKDAGCFGLQSGGIAILPEKHPTLLVTLPGDVLQQVRSVKVGYVR